MEFEISADDFADKFTRLYTGDYWGFKPLMIHYLKHSPEITAELGLKHCKHYYASSNSESFTLVFNVINKKKWFLTKIKYGI